MSKSKLLRIALGIAGAALIGVCIARIIGGANPYLSALWAFVGVILGIVAVFLKTDEEKIKSPALIGVAIAAAAALVFLGSSFSGDKKAGTAHVDTSVITTDKADGGHYSPQGATDVPINFTHTEIPEGYIAETPSLSPAVVSTPLPHISWTEEHYVDDFNDPTDETYIRGHFNGTFSNSATDSSRLSVYMYFDKVLDIKSTNYFKIRLFEYGDNLVEYSITDKEDVIVKIKINGKVYEAHPDRLSEKDIYIMRSSSIYAAIIGALNRNQEIQVVIIESRYTTSTYRFTVDSYGLDELDHNWKP